MSRIHMDLTENLPSTILEVGGIDRPLLARSRAYRYYGMDIESRRNCFDIYDRFFVQTIEVANHDIRADLIVSITLLEHVPNNRAAVHAIFEMLSEGGRTHHYVPSKWHPYSIILRAVGPKFQKKLIKLLRPDAVEVSGYPAFFDYCAPAQMRGLFSECGYGDIEIKSFWRASDYFAFFVPAFIIVSTFENICAFFKLNFFASGFIVSAVKPLSSGLNFSTPHFQGL